MENSCGVGLWGHGVVSWSCEAKGNGSMGLSCRVVGPWGCGAVVWGCDVQGPWHGAVGSWGLGCRVGVIWAHCECKAEHGEGGN